MLPFDLECRLDRGNLLTVKAVVDGEQIDMASYRAGSHRQRLEIAHRWARDKRLSNGDADTGALATAIANELSRAEIRADHLAHEEFSIAEERFRR